MATALIVYGTNVAASVTTAGKLATGTGGTGAAPTTLVGTATNFGQLYALGNAGAWLAHSGAITDSACNPDNNGFLLDSTVLEGNSLIAGTWAPIARLAVNANTCTADVYCRAFKRSSGGVFTPIGTWVTTGQSFGTANVNYSPTPSSVPAMPFGVGDKLYIDWWLNITASTMVAGNTIKVNVSSTTSGLANDEQVTTPGYNPTLYGHDMTFTGVG